MEGSRRTTGLDGASIAVLCLMIAHRDQSVPLISEAGFRASKPSGKDRPDTFPGHFGPVASRRNSSFATVAGAAPASHRLPNYLADMIGKHLELA
jgi:hypothetical protein